MLWLEGEANLHGGDSRLGRTHAATVLRQCSVCHGHTWQRASRVTVNLAYLYLLVGGLALRLDSSIRRREEKVVARQSHSQDRDFRRPRPTEKNSTAHDSFQDGYMSWKQEVFM